jgi:hypothetical protein
LLLALAAACSGNGSDDDTSRDAGVDRDGGRDGGVFAVPCGTDTCLHPLRYCRSTPTGPCVATDGGTCTAPEEACRDEAIVGCTSGQTHECVDLPADCDACGACIILASPCGAQIQTVNCASSPTEGVRVQCPFP